MPGHSSPDELRFKNALMRALQPLSRRQQKRAILWLCKRAGLLPAEVPDEPVHRGGAMVDAFRERFRAYENLIHAERVLLVGSDLKTRFGMADFATVDVSRLLAMAGEKPLPNTAVAMRNAVKKGWLRVLGRQGQLKRFAVTPSGEETIRTWVPASRK